LKLGFSRFAKHLPLLDGTIVSAIKLCGSKAQTNTCHLIVKNKTQRANFLCAIASMENFSGDLNLGVGLLRTLLSHPLLNCCLCQTTVQLNLQLPLLTIVTRYEVPSPQTHHVGRQNTSATFSPFFLLFASKSTRTNADHVTNSGFCRMIPWLGEAA
jgi:hypothetical protein